MMPAVSIINPGAGNKCDRYKYGARWMAMDFPPYVRLERESKFLNRIDLFFVKNRGNESRQS